jgi:hypothetical protein
MQLAVMTALPVVTAESAWPLPAAALVEGALADAAAGAGAGAADWAGATGAVP